MLHAPPLSKDEDPTMTTDPHHQARLAAIGQLAASIAHEVDQPLAAIALHAAAALRCIERAQAPAQAQAALCAVLEASRQASDIVRSVRALAGAARIDPAACRLDAAIDDVLAERTHDLSRLDVTCCVAVDAGARAVHAHPVQLRQLLRNLVANALDALAGVAGRTRTLSLRARVDAAGRVRVTVRDNGCGIDAATAAQALEPLVSTKPHGLGLGLAICRAIAGAHGGELRLVPNAGHGCTAGFTLARAAAHDVHASPTPCTDQEPAHG